MTKKEAELYREAAHWQGYYNGVKQAHFMIVTGQTTDELVHESFQRLTQASDALNVYRAERGKK